LDLVPIGVIGELLIGGMGVAIGYLHRPDLTEERFIPDPVGNSGRVYRTGDLCRWLENGEIEYVGRDDGMVKVNGYRIELNEVRDNLEHITGAEVLKIEDKLIAFVTPANVNVEKVLEAAFIKLPYYMVPSLIVPMESFPLTGNGKVDKKLLAEMDIQSLLQTDSGRFEDLNENELKIALVISKILNIELETLSPKSDFFNLGGDSITAIGLVQGILRETGFTLMTKEVFSKRTIKRLATALKDAKPTELKPMVVRYFLFQLIISDKVIQEIMTLYQERLQLDKDAMDVFPCTPLQSAMFGNTMEDKNAFVNRLIYKADGKWSAFEICEAWKKVVQKHDILRTCFVQVQGRVYQIVRPYVNLTPIQSKDNIQETLDRMKETGITAVLNNWISLTVVKPKEVETHVILQLHHCMYDGWSMNLLESDFYNFLSVDTDLKLTERVSFKPFAQYIEGQDVELRNGLVQGI
jgi:acyl carrier protein